jgi:AraC-like DNA-binding protein
VAYREFAAPAELADLVVCTWERTVPGSDAPSTQRVVPDGCVDIVWRGAQLQVAGPDTTAFMSLLEPGATIVGLRFRPGFAGTALGLPASELRDTRVALDAAWGRPGSELEERLGCAAADHERRRLLEAAVASRRPTTEQPDQLVLAASHRLGLPGSRVGSISRALGMSERQLLRRFKAAVGYGPKTLDRVLRFQRFLSSARMVTRGDENLAGIAAELGYADQAHLTRECVELAGLTPRQLLVPGA